VAQYRGRVTKTRNSATCARAWSNSTRPTLQSASFHYTLRRWTFRAERGAQPSHRRVGTPQARHAPPTQDDGHPMPPVSPVCHRRPVIAVSQASACGRRARAARRARVARAYIYGTFGIPLMRSIFKVGETARGRQGSGLRWYYSPWGGFPQRREAP
jgi:hypothetical protein